MVTGEVFAGDKRPKSKAKPSRKQEITFETIALSNNLPDVVPTLPLPDLIPSNPPVTPPTPPPMPPLPDIVPPVILPDVVPVPPAPPMALSQPDLVSDAAPKTKQKSGFMAAMKQIAKGNFKLKKVKQEPKPVIVSSDKADFMSQILARREAIAGEKKNNKFKKAAKQVIVLSAEEEKAREAEIAKKIAENKERAATLRKQKGPEWEANRKKVLAEVEVETQKRAAEAAKAIREQKAKDLEATYKHFDSSLERHQLETQHQKIRQDKVDAKTTDEMLTAISREHEFFKSLDGNIQYRQFNNQYINYSQHAIEHEERALLPRLKDMVAAVERNNVFATSDILAELKGSKDLAATYKHFDSSLERHQFETQHQQIRQDKVDAKTTDEMLTAISREHEFFKSLDGKLKYAENYDSSILSAISNAKTIEQDTLITNMHNMLVYAQNHGILNDQDILNQFNSHDSRNVLNNLSKTCEKHYMDHHNENIKQLLDDEHVMVGLKKYTCPLKYMKHEMQNNIPSFVDEKQISSTFAKVKAEVKELRLERELEHTMTMRF